MSLTPGVLRVENVPGAALGLLPCWRLLPETVRRPAWLKETTPLETLPYKAAATGATNSNNKVTFFVAKKTTLVFDPYQTSPCRQGGGKISPNLPGRFGLSFFSFWDSFFDSVLPFTPHNPESLHNFLGGWEGPFWQTLGCVGLWDVCVSYYAPELEFSYFENVELET